MNPELQHFATWLLLAVYVLAVLVLVVKGAGKTKNLQDYALGSLFFSPVAVGLSLAASMTSAATFVINPGFIANFGLAGFISFGVIFPAAAIISLVVLTKSFRKYGETVRALTLAQWIGKRYESPGFSFFIAFLSLLLITFIVLIVVALSKVIAVALGLAELWVMVSIVVFVFGYMMYGGANSMVYTNTIQAAIMLLVAVILLVSGFQFFKEGFAAMFAQLNTIDPVLTQTTNPGSPLFRDYYEIIFAQIIVGIAVVVQPHIITKSLLLKEDRDVRIFLRTAVLAQIIFFLVVFVGFFARLTFPDLSMDGKALGNDGIVPAYVVYVFSETTIGVLIGLLVILGLISAGMSTLEGLVQSVSSSITSDIIRPLLPARLNTDRNLFIINRFAIVFLAIATILLSYQQLLEPKLSVGIFAQNGVYAFFSAAFIPVIAGIFYRNVPKLVPILASVAAIVTHFTVYYVLPIFVKHFDWSFGFFTKYLEGEVRNPAIASSTAIMISLVVAIITWQILKRRRP